MAYVAGTVWDVVCLWARFCDAGAVWCIVVDVVDLVAVAAALVVSHPQTVFCLSYLLGCEGGRSQPTSLTRSDRQG